MQKILYIALGENLNGTERFILDLIKYLPENKYDIYFGVPYESKLSEIIRKKGIKVFNFKNNSMDGFKPVGIYEIYKFIRDNGISIVHSNSGIIPCVVGKMLGLKKCYETRHGLFYTDEYMKRMSLLKYLHEYVKQFFVEYQVAISDNDKKRLIDFFSYSEKKINVIYNGINATDFAGFSEAYELNQRRNDGVFRFLNIGRFTYQKGQDILIRAAALLRKETDNFRLTLIGQGEDRSNLENLIRENGLSDFVCIEGYKTDIFDHIVKYDGLVMSSRYEGVPYVVLESMAIGLPVVSTKVGGIDNVIKNGQGGIIVDEGDAVGLKNAMLRLVNDKDLRSYFGNNARKAVLNYSIENMARHYDNMYSS
ncbi:MAG: glycosyltransferase [Bacteroidetes bacterium]|nr:glycosyltransferase [Bacteroidota bacterium]